MVAALFIAGDHVPAIPFKEVVGRLESAAPAQIAGRGVNVGVKIGFTTIVIVVVNTQVPLDGVNVYVVVAVLFIAGDQVPEIPLFEVVGKGLKVAPTQIGAIAVNVGVMFGLTVIVSVVVVAHCPAVGVKV